MSVNHQSAIAKDMAIPAELLAYYLAAIMQKDRPLENEIALFLDSITQPAWELLSPFAKATSVV